MNNSIAILAGFVVAIVVVVGAIVYFSSPSNAPGIYDEFATCLGNNGAVFYGAFWCPHCADQKALFGSSAKNLPYVECSTADRQGQTQQCIAAGVASYPTWEFVDGSRLNGVVPLQQLAAKTGCSLSGNSS